MKIAYISDLHFEFRTDLAWPILIDGRFDGLQTIGFPEYLDADVLIVAGDIHGSETFRDRLKKVLAEHYGIPVLMVEGNHDFYDSPFPADQQGDVAAVQGHLFALAPLWTYLRPMDEIGCIGFPDFEHIKGLTPAAWNKAHVQQVEFLRQSNAEVIVTHHAPFPKSISPAYANHPDNCFFANRLDPTLFPNCKLWIHGHVHQNFDYEYEGIRVVCNPLGYPFERKVQPVRIVEI